MDRGQMGTFMVLIMGAIALVVVSITLLVAEDVANEMVAESADVEQETTPTDPDPGSEGFPTTLLWGIVIGTILLNIVLRTAGAPSQEPASSQSRLDQLKDEYTDPDSDMTIIEFEEQADDLIEVKQD